MDQFICGLARAYFKVLSTVDWSDTLVTAGLREGLNKFLSNAHLSLFTGVNKYHKAHYVSPAALKKLEVADHSRLVLEHVVPKTRYIQEPCELRASDGSLTVEFIEDLLRRYWYLATITVEEDRRLGRTHMPTDWNGEDIFARYDAAGVTLVANPYFEPRGQAVSDR